MSEESTYIGQWGIKKIGGSAGYNEYSMRMGKWEFGQTWAIAV